MTPGKVQVELQVLMEKAKAQVKSFKKEMGDALEGKTGGAAGRSSGLEKETSKVTAHTKAVKEMNKAIQDTKFKTAEYYKSLDAFGKPYKGKISLGTPIGKPQTGPIQYGPSAPDGPGGTGPAYAAYKAKVALLNNVYEQMDVVNAQMQAARARAAGGGAQPKTIASILNNVITAPLSKFGAMAVQGIGALAALRVAVGLVSYAFRLITAPIRAFAGVMQSAANAARATYAKALQSGGLPMGFIVQRAALAAVIGVSEGEVYKYAGAVQHLNSQLQWSTKIMTETNPTLTALGWQFHVVGNDFKALSAKVADSFAVMTKEMLNWIDRVTKGAGDAIDESNRRISEGVYNDSRSGARPKGSPRVEFEGGGGTGRPRGIVGDTTGEQWKKFLEFHAQRMGWGKDKAPSPDTGYKRMQGSAWERMGLVVGAGTAVNYQAATARNTDIAAKLLARLVTLFPTHVSNAARKPNPNRT